MYILLIWIVIDEQENVWKDESAAWPVANPVVTCASVSEAGFPSNFVADPFLYVQVKFSEMSLFFLGRGE